jgi:hypothetical protein
MKVGEDQFQSGDFKFWMNVDGNATAVIPQGAGTIDVESDLDPCAVPCEVLVDGVVKDLEYTVMQASLVCWPDVHPGPLAHAGKAFEFVNFRGVVKLLCDGR